MQSRQCLGSNSRQYWRRSVANIGDDRLPISATVGRQSWRPPRRPAHNRCALSSQPPATATRGAIVLEDNSGSVKTCLWYVVDDYSTSSLITDTITSI
ncbi:hypothetical protein Y032_0258g431 [Ancylostoma ceylanicum]|uniref:Uncharacterized protein n=1 Tax=Ancylostoma ceylanicum TaxID=53326 RepID=A0A016SAK9_9BILA|nr:hypothetical protein Y032_0258g431 [Ancylostoma ceylanicum]